MLVYITSFIRNRYEHYKQAGDKIFPEKYPLQPPSGFAHLINSEMSEPGAIYSFLLKFSPELVILSNHAKWEIKKRALKNRF
jgi:hypothetical protein